MKKHFGGGVGSSEIPYVVPNLEPAARRRLMKRLVLDLCRSSYIS